MNSHDILYISLAIAALVLTFFLAWLLYYLISIVRKANTVMREVAESIARVQRVLDSVESALSSTSSHLGLVMSAVKELTGLYVRRRAKKKRKAEDDDSAEREEAE